MCRGQLQNPDMNRGREPGSAGIPAGGKAPIFRQDAGAPRAGSWKAPIRFFACIGTMNLQRATPSFTFIVPPAGLPAKAAHASGPDRLKPELRESDSLQAIGFGHWRNQIRDRA